LYINTSNPKNYRLDLNVLPLGYTSATLRYPPLPAPLRIYHFIWLSPLPLQWTHLTGNDAILVSG